MQPHKMISKKQREENARAFDEGWGLFDTGEGIALQRLDDPPNARPLKCDCDNTHEANGTCCRACWAEGHRKVAPAEPVFDSDDEAEAFVRAEAAKGSEFHQAALDSVTAVRA